MAHSIDPSLANFKHMVIEPFPGKLRSIPIFPRGHKLNESDVFAGQHLVLYQPHQPYPNDFKYECLIKPIDKNMRLKTLIIAYAKNLIDMCTANHKICRKESCGLCKTLMPEARAELVEAEEFMDRSKGKGWSSARLAYYLRGMMRQYSGPPTPNSWAHSTKGLRELCSLLRESRSQPKRWNWDRVVFAHMRMGGLDLISSGILREAFFMENPLGMERKAMLALRCGRYENILIYAEESSSST